LNLLAVPNVLRQNSRALRADIFETTTCAGLSAMILAGLVINVALGWTWAYALAAIVLMPMITREVLKQSAYEALMRSGTDAPTCRTHPRVRQITRKNLRELIMKMT
jgi:divalent metal cation (Fe/Co/Zn/Cd) transporter